jgi:hypothetical protein
MKDRSQRPSIITNQFRNASGMVYELKCATSKLTIRTCPRSSPTDAGEWRVEASARLAPNTEPVMLAEWGATRVEALRDVARSWSRSASRLGLPVIDWDSVTEALAAVRALEAQPRGAR